MRRWLACTTRNAPRPITRPHTYAWEQTRHQVHAVHDERQQVILLRLCHLHCSQGGALAELKGAAVLSHALLITCHDGPPEGLLHAAVALHDHCLLVSLSWDVCVYRYGSMQMVWEVQSREICEHADGGPCV